MRLGLPQLIVVKFADGVGRVATLLETLSLGTEQQAQRLHARAAKLRPQRLAPPDWLFQGAFLGSSKKGECWLGLGTTGVPPGPNGTWLTLTAPRKFHPRRLFFPPTTAGLEVLEVQVNGEIHFRSTQGVPVEWFAELSRGRSYWPPLKKGDEMEFHVRRTSASP